MAETGPIDGSCICVVDFAGQTQWPPGCRASNGGRLERGQVVLPPGAVFILKQTLNEVLGSRTLLLEITLPNEGDEELFEAKLQVNGPNKSFDHVLTLGAPYDQCWNFCSMNGHPIQLSQETGWKVRHSLRLILDASQKTVALLKGGGVAGGPIPIDNVWRIAAGSTVQIMLRNHSQEDMAVHRVGLWSCVDGGTEPAVPAVPAVPTPVLPAPVLPAPVNPAPVNPAPVNPAPSHARSTAEWPYDVFISHAGTIKELADELEADLRRLGFTAFVDKNALHPGDDADRKIVEAARQAPVGLVLFNRDFVQREWPMAELKLIVEEGTLLPVVVGMSHTEFKEAWRASYVAGAQLDEAFFKRVERTTFLVDAGGWQRKLRERICFSVLRMFVEQCCPRLPDTARSMRHVTRALTAAQGIVANHLDSLSGRNCEEAKIWVRYLENIRDGHVPFGTAVPRVAS